MIYYNILNIYALKKYISFSIILKFCIKFILFTFVFFFYTYKYNIGILNMLITYKINVIQT